MILSIYVISLYCNIKHLLKLENICINLDLRMTNASMRLPHRLQGQKVKSQSHGAGAYCGGHLAAQLVITIIVMP